MHINEMRPYAGPMLFAAMVPVTAGLSYRRIINFRRQSQ